MAPRVLMRDVHRRSRATHRAHAMGGRFGGVLEAREALEIAIRTVPVPGAPPPQSREQASVGLAFLDIALRQNHVRRITERLELVEHLAGKCTTEIDLNLRALDAQQSAACSSFDRLTQRSPDSGNQQDGGRMLWVPVARLSRKANVPIDVRNSSGEKVPRLAQLEVAELIAAGLHQLFKGILTSLPGSRSDDVLGRFLYRVDESRWLFQSALRALLVAREQPHRLVPEPPTEGTVPGASRHHRDFVISILDKYSDELSGYLELVDVALNDYLLVVGLGDERKDHQLAYERPLEVSRPRRHRGLTALSSWTHGTYRVDYNTQVPASLRAFHLVAETEPSLRIDTMVLTSDVDADFVAELASDMEFLAGRIDEVMPSDPTGPDAKVLEQEAHIAVSHMAEVVRRRTWGSVDRGGLLLSRTPAIQALSRALLSGEVPHDSTHRRTSLLRHPSVTSERLVEASKELTAMDLGSDFATENDPSSSRAHLYWRRTGWRATPSGSRTTIRASIIITDSTATRPYAVLRYVLAVGLISYLQASLLAGSILPFLKNDTVYANNNADALVAVLLLVPGFLFTRLELPRRTSIGSRVGFVPRVAAVATMGVAVVEALGVAVGSPAAIKLAFGVGSVSLLTIAVLLGVFAIRTPKLGRAAMVEPQWALRRPISSRPEPDMILASSGVTS